MKPSQGSHSVVPGVVLDLGEPERLEHRRHVVRDEGYDPALTDPAEWRPRARRPGSPRRATVRVSVEGRRLAALLGRLQPLRVKRDIPADRDGWLTATFRLDSMEAATIDVSSLGPHIEVVAPQELRTSVADWARRTARLYRRG
jgi:hypothetical protein